MSTPRDPEDHGRQIDRVIGEAERPADAAKETPEIAEHGHPDRRRGFRTTNFSRMKLEWGPEQRIQVQEIEVIAERLMRQKFAVAYDLRHRVLLCVRMPRMKGGEVLAGADGEPQWESHPNGSPIEDWTLLTDTQREQFLFEITMHMFEWEQAAVGLWSEAMYAKVEWEQAFAQGYLSEAGKLTIQDRTQYGHSASADDRYFAIFRSALSRHADALVKSMGYLAQMLRGTKL